ncbi:MAG: glycoside hydrolase family 5 protein [Planctomycetota bacterium]
MKRVLFALSLVIASVPCHADDRTGDPASPDGTRFPVRFRVNGNRIVDPSGKPQIFRGVVSMDPILQTWPGNPDEGSWNEAYYAEMAEWGAKIVRLQIHPNVWRVDKTKAMQLIDQSVKWIGKHGMYVLLDFHSIGFVPTGSFDDRGRGEDQLKTTEEEMTDFWVQLAKQFVDNDVVAFYELFNEPVIGRGRLQGTRSEIFGARVEWLKWRAMQERIVDAIREVDDHTPIICSGLDYTFDLSHVQDDPVRRDNIVYAVHIYPDRTRSKWDWYENFVKTAELYPVFCTEWGFVADLRHRYGLFGFEIIYGHDGAFRKEIIECLESHGISWTAWRFSVGQVGPNLLQNWSYTPTESGVFVRDQLQAN